MPKQPPTQSTFRAPLPAATAGDLGSVIERAALLRTLDKKLRQSLPEPLASHVRLGNMRDGRLVFLVDSPVWKAKLRLYADVIRDAASAAGLATSGMTVKVATMLPVPPDAASLSPLTQAARDSLRAAAAAVEDPELKSQLLNLASMA